MNAIAAPVANPVQAPTKTAKEVRSENLAIAHERNLPMVEIKGNSFPCKSVLWTFAGEYDSQTRTWRVPEHKAQEAQAIVNRFTPGTAEYAAEQAEKAKAKPATASTAPKASAQRTVVKTPAPVAETRPTRTLTAEEQTRLRIKTTAMADVVGKLLTELKGTAAERAFAEGVEQIKVAAKLLAA